MIERLANVSSLREKHGFVQIFDEKLDKQLSFNNQVGLQQLNTHVSTMRTILTILSLILTILMLLEVIRCCAMYKIKYAGY